MKNIALIINDISTSGGTEKAALQLAKILSGKHCVTIISVKTKEDKEIFFNVPDSVRIVHFGLNDVSKNYLYKPFVYYWFLKKLNKFIYAQNISIAISFTHNYSFLLNFLKKEREIMKIAAEHVTFHDLPTISKFLVKNYYKKLSGVVVLSQAAYDFYAQINRKVVIIPNSIIVSSKTFSMERKNEIIMVGRLVKEKGFERIIDLALHLKNSYSNWTINIYGDGDFRHNLELMIEKNNISDNVILHGNVKDIAKCYKQSSIFLMTSYSEAMPMVILEAKSFEIPVVAFDCEGTSLLINHEKDGYLIDNNHPEYLIQIMSQLISDNNLRFEIGSKGLQSIKKFSEENVLNLWESFLALKK